MYDCSRITERLFIGANVNGPQDVDDIQALGITHVIDANTDDEHQLFEDNLPYRITLLSNPTGDDGKFKDVDWFQPAIIFGMAALGMSQNILLCHCAAGVNRGPSLGYAIMRCLGWPRDEALEWIHLKRPQTFGGVRYASDADDALKKLGWIK